MFQTQCFNSDIKNLRTSYAFCVLQDKSQIENLTFILQVTLVDINSSFNSDVDLSFLETFRQTKTEPWAIHTIEIHNFFFRARLFQDEAISKANPISIWSPWVACCYRWDSL